MQRPTPSSASGVKGARPGPSAARPGPGPTGQPSRPTVQRPSGAAPSRPTSATPSAVPSRPTSAAPSTGTTRKANSESIINVYSNVKHTPDSGIPSLLGDYIEKGINHGRKTYQKYDKIPGHESVQVYIYYWDERDGPDFCGWWFGDKVGGSQVWSRADTHTQLPPRDGWRIPWDGPYVKDMLLVDVPGAGPPSKPSSAVPSVAKSANRPPPPPKTRSANSFQEEIEATIERVESIEAKATETLNIVKEGLAGDVSDDVLQELAETLKEKQDEVNSAQKALAQQIDNAKSSGNNTTALSKLSPRLRSLQTALMKEASRISDDIGQKAEEERRATERKKAEMTSNRDAQLFQESLPASTDIVVQAEDSVETVAIMVSSLSTDDDDEELGEDARRTMDEIEEAANKAQNALSEAKQHIATRLSGAKRYSEKTRKLAMHELSELQSRLADATKKLAPFKRFKPEWEQKIAAKKAIKEVVRILGVAELEVEKAHIMSSARLENQMTEDEIKSAEGLLTPAQSGINKAQQSIADKKAKSRDEGALADELKKLELRVQQSQTKLEEVKSILQRQREGLRMQDMLQALEENLRMVDDAFLKTSDAELPFLKGVDVLPKDEGTQAFQDSEEAIASTENAIGQARKQLKTRQADTKRFSSATSKRFTNELHEFSERLEVYVKKLHAFKKTTAQRKTKALLHEISNAVEDAERQVQSLAEACKVFISENLDSVSVETLKTTCESSAIAEKHASDAVNKAKQIVSAHQKDAKDGGSGSIASTPEFKRLDDRVSTAMSDLLQHKKAVANGDRLIKSKHLLGEEDAKLKTLGEELSKVEELTTPEKPSEEALKRIDTAIAAVQTSNQASTRSLNQMNEGALVPVKAALSKLIAQNKAVQDRINKVKSYCSEQRELVSSELWIAEAVSKIEAIEKVIEQANTAELPFLKGIDVLPAEESEPALTQSEAASEAAHKAINDARDYIATQLIEAKKFKGGKAIEITTKELNKLTERINSSSTVASKFKKDTENRRRSATMRDTIALVTSVEEEVAKTTEAAAPLHEDKESLPPDAAKEVCKNIAKLEKAAQQRIDQVKGILDKRGREMKGHAREEEQIAGLQKRLKAGQSQLARARKASSEHEQKFVGKMLLAQAGDILKDTEAEVEKVRSAAAPLLDGSGTKFLAASNVLFLVEALKEHMQKTDKTLDKLFQDVCGNDSAASRAQFEAYLEKLPDDIGRDDLIYTADQREAIHAYVDTDEDGAISLIEFKEMFSQRFICIKSISITDGFEISASKTVAKLEVDEVVEFLGEPKPAKGGSLHRVECKVVQSGKVGWVTMKGNQGTEYFETFSPYNAFVKTMDRILHEATKTVGKATSFVKAKASELATYTEGPLANAGIELEKLKPRSVGAQKDLQELKIKISEAKREYQKREESEKRTQQEMRDKKAAGVILKPVLAKVELMETSLQKFLSAAKALSSVDGAALEAVAEPLTISETAEKDAAQLNKDIAALKASVTEQQSAVSKAVQGPMNEAKQELIKIRAKAELADKECSSTMEAVRKARNKLATTQVAKLSDGLRSEVMKRDITIEVLFSEIAGKEQEKISEDAFCKHVASLDHMSMPVEHAKLVWRQLEAEGIGRAAFHRMLQKYYIVVKQIAITTEFAISKSKTTRMLEPDEVLELLEGPQVDPKLGVTRVRAKALTDGLSGWISVKGNQGTPFLKETYQPCYFFLKEIALEKDFVNTSDSEGILRYMKVDEAFEVVEGPRKIKYDDASRAKGKACKDGKEGWFTVKTKDGTINAEKAAKHFTCTAGIALTDVRDIKKGKTVRKLEVGETVLVLDGPVEESSGVKRIQCRSLKDGQEGWVTIKGNAGTVFAEENTRLYVLLHDTQLGKAFTSAEDALLKGAAVRTLSKGEVVEVFEGPKDEKFDEVHRLRGRATHDGALGWVTFKSYNMKSWSPWYKCVTNTVIHDSISGKTAHVVRRIEADEIVEVLDGPKEDTEMSVMRIKGRAQKDGAVGWITIKGNQGSVYLKPI